MNSAIISNHMNNHATVMTLALINDAVQYYWRGTTKFSLMQDIIDRTYDQLNYYGPLFNDDDNRHQAAQVLSSYVDQWPDAIRSGDWVGASHLDNEESDALLTDDLTDADRVAMELAGEVDFNEFCRHNGHHV